MKKMKKIMLLLFLVVGIVSLGGCTNSSQDSLEYVKDKGTLVIGVTDFPPMGYLEGGETVGFDIDLATLVASELGVDLVIQYIDWDSKVFELESRAIDCIWNGMTITDERKTQMTFSNKYLDNNLIILTKLNSPIDTLADLTGKVVGVESSSSGELAVRANTNLFNSLSGLDLYGTSSEALMALEGGSIDAVVVDEIYARYYVLKNSNNYEIGTQIVGVEEYGIGFRLQDVSLCQEVDDIIDRLAEEGKIETISIKWFGVNLFNRD